MHSLKQVTHVDAHERVLHRMLNRSVLDVMALHHHSAQITRRHVWTISSIPEQDAFLDLGN